MGKTLRVKKPLQTRVLPSEGKHTRTLVYLHGMDATPAGCIGRWAKVMPLTVPGLRVVLPGAQWMHVDCMEEDCVSWFNLAMLDNGEGGAEPASLRAATARIVAVVRREVERVGAANVYLGGMSAGMTMGLH